MRAINRHPGRLGVVLSALAPFVLLALVYVIASDLRLAANPDDKLLPAIATVRDAVVRMAFEENQRTGQYLLWVDTLASLQRLAAGVGLAATFGFAIGVANGVLPWAAAFGSPLVRVISMIPPLALLPILFIVFGLGEFSKYVLIMLGTAPFIMRDIEQRVRDLPPEQITKAQTLDASTWQIVVRVVIPQVLPRLIDAVRLSLGPAWLFLIAAEAIASTEGLGYRIFLVRRYLAMDVILPYVAWITVLAFITDYSLRWVGRRLFPWDGVRP